MRTMTRTHRAFHSRAPNDSNLSFGLLFVFALCSCATAPVRSTGEKPGWFSRGNLRNKNLVLLPIQVEKKTLSRPDVVESVARAIRRRFRGSRVIPVEPESDVIDAELLEWSHPVSPVQPEVFSRLASAWKESFNADYAIFVQVRKIESYSKTYQETDPPQSLAQLQDGEKPKEYTERTVWVSGAAVTVRVLILQIPDGSLCWVGRSETESEKQNQVKEYHSTNWKDDLLDNFLHGLVGGLTGLEKSGYPEVPVSEAIAKGVSKALSRMPR